MTDFPNVLRTVTALEIFRTTAPGLNDPSNQGGDTKDDGASAASTHGRRHERTPDLEYARAVSENLHPVRKVIVGDVSADIDEELAPIVEAIWRLGLTTWTSCQNAGESNADWPQLLPHMGPIIAAQLGWAYIDFPIHDGLAFLTALAQAGPRDAFYLRMAHWAAPDSWDVSARPMDAATFDHTRESQFGLQLLMVRFPSYDREEILRRLTAYEAGRLTAPGPVDRSSMTPQRPSPKPAR